jgi:hypothetical protein
LVNKKISNNLLLDSHYKQKRQQWSLCSKNYKRFKKFVTENVMDHNQYKDKLIIVNVMGFYDGPLDGLGVYNNKWCHFKNREDIVRPKFRYYNDHYYEDCDCVRCSYNTKSYNDLVDEMYEQNTGEPMIDLYYEVVMLDDHELDKNMRYLFLCSDHLHNGFTEIVNFHLFDKDDVFNVKKISYELPDKEFDTFYTRHIVFNNYVS